jgi:hypothetical protein
MPKKFKLQGKNKDAAKFSIACIICCSLICLIYMLIAKLVLKKEKPFDFIDKILNM